MVQKAAGGSPRKGAALAGGRTGGSSAGRSAGTAGGGGTYQGTKYVKQGNVQPGRSTGKTSRGKRA